MYHTCAWNYVSWGVHDLSISIAQFQKKGRGTRRIRGYARVNCRYTCGIGLKKQEKTTQKKIYGHFIREIFQFSVLVCWANCSMAI